MIGRVNAVLDTDTGRLNGRSSPYDGFAVDIALLDERSRLKITVVKVQENFLRLEFVFGFGREVTCLEKSVLRNVDEKLIGLSDCAVN